jgi:cellulose synthase/poly-beta-1,6-N-acetylglucosamine synthase-like glycosyltransferase
MLHLMLSGVLIGVVVLLWLPLLSELLCILARRRVPSAPSRTGEVPRLLILVPAHNEELMIEGCVRSLLDMSYPGDATHIVVIADNCTDATARLAGEQGVPVMERVDPDFPGKPQAIAWALSQINLQEWDACVIVDADSTVAPGFAAGLAKLAPLNDIVFQPNNLVLNEFESWLTRLGGLWGRRQFEVTVPLKQSAGLNCSIGNGMGIGTNLLIRDGWRSHSITEDSELYAVYTEAGVRIHHASAADIFAQESRSLGEGAIQRRRWLAGRIRVIQDWCVRIIRSPRIGWHQKLDMFVELGLSSPVLHLIIAFTVAAAALFALPGVSGRWIAFLALASVSGLAVTTIVAIVRHPQPWRTISSFFMLPAYAAWRIIVAVSTLLTLRDTTWRRTARPAPHVASAVPMTDRPA